MKEITRMNKDERKAEFIRLFQEFNKRFFRVQFEVYFAMNGKYKPIFEANQFPNDLGQKGFYNAKSKIQGYLQVNSNRCPSVFALQMLIDFIEELKK